MDLTVALQSITVSNNLLQSVTKRVHDLKAIRPIGGVIKLSYKHAST